MIKVRDAFQCCGCEACAQRCPRDCIEMKADQEGFYYPTVNEAECIDCGLCDKVCAMQVKKDLNENVLPKAYVAFAKDNEIRKKSSSGGLFTVLASAVIKQNGCVWSGNVGGL